MLVYIQGSAWRKQNVIEHIIPLSNIAKKGFVVAIVQYRDTSIAPFPAQIEDTKTAISFLVEHHQDYQIDTKNIFLGGDSSGGHTAIMTGITANQNILELEEFKYASSIQGIFDFYGPTLVSEMQNEPSIQDHVTPTSPEGLLLGGVNVLEHKQEAYQASPLPYIKKDVSTPPILMIHGNKDRLVPFGQSVLLYNTLKENNKDVTFYCVENADHGGAAFWNNQVLEITYQFLKEHIKK
ncbi:MAG: alpha/beta hydrolase fold domain-containing protein [Faecalibacillus intestinalis]|uniref:alpha/beta hydrolase fold domain-containing protein n=1 Tax=Faecalibacillus intestinalis TaxID=1982626 RepID=UPI003996B3D9